MSTRVSTHVMRASTPTRRRLVVPAAVALVALVVTAGTVAAFNPQPEPPGRWVLSVVDEQALSLSAVNLAGRGDRRARFEYTDANLRTLASQDLAVAPGTFATLHVHPPDPIIPPDPVHHRRRQATRQMAHVTGCRPGSCLALQPSGRAPTTTPAAP